jgi:hypothetical protein
MGEVIKLILPFFYTTKNYGDVLKKLAMFAFYETYLITFLLRNIPRIDAFFTTVESWGSIGNAVRTIPHYDVLNMSGIVIAFLVALLTHMFQFRDRISDVLRIRRRFDVKNILIPLSQRVGAATTTKKEAQIREHRDDLMHTVFYKYASSGAKNPLVDRHDIEHALNAWSWFWVFVEAIVYFAVGAIIGFSFGSPQLGLGFVVVCAALVIFAVVQSFRLPRYARPQVASIANDPTAAYDVKNTFDAL